MNIAILDDEQKIVSYIEEILKGNSEDKIFSYTNVNDFILLLKDTLVDILFLDIKLKEINGIEFVKQHQKALKSTKIIYITGYDEYIEETFETNPTYFLRKPLSKEKIEKAYKKAIKLKKEENLNVMILMNQEWKKIKVNDIYFIESEARIIHIHFQNEIISCYKKLSEFEKELPSYFLRIHKSYLVNMKKIESYKTSAVILDNKEELLISRSYMKICKQKIMKYLEENYE